MSRPRRRILATTSLALGAVALTLLVLELGLRVGSAVPPGHREVWRSTDVVPVADPALQFVNRPRPGPDPVSAEGFRGAGPERPRRPGVPRVAVLGDSVTYGIGVAGAAAYPAQLAPLLGERLGRPVEVLNAGVPGFDIVQVAAMYRARVRELEPDVVVYGFFSNDLEAQRSLLVDGDPPTVVGVVPRWSLLPGELYLPLPVHEALTRHSFLYNWLNLRLLAWTETARLPNRLDDEARRRGVAALRELADQVRADGGALLVALLPVVLRRHPDPTRCADPGIDATPWPGYCEYNERVLTYAADLCRRLGIQVVDLRPAYWTLPERSLAASRDDPNHPNGQGHRLLAAALVGPVAERLDAPAETPTGDRAPDAAPVTDPASATTTDPASAPTTDPASAPTPATAPTTTPATAPAPGGAP